MNVTLNVKRLGQVFTPPSIAARMLRLRQNHGTLLEPAAGDGAFLSALKKIKPHKKVTAIEIDLSQAKKCNAQCMDFFDYPVTQKFDTIIGNPPYVRHRDIDARTRKKLAPYRFDARSNLYLFFIAKSVQHLTDGGELIFITPRDFLKATSAAKLNQLLYDAGTITDYVELGDAKIFADATPNCAIWRFVKGDFSRMLRDHRKFKLINGQIAFVGDDYTVPFADLFTVKVGAVSGMDAVFSDAQHGNRDFVYSQTAATGKTRRMIYDLNHRALLPHKKQLLARKIRAFDETNWWKWGRAHFDSPRPRIYVNAKTRNPAPFFLHPAHDYDGAILAIFPNKNPANLPALCAKLNQVKWNELGFVCDGRFLFAQRSLQNCLLPSAFTADRHP